MIVEPHSTKLPQSWDTESDQLCAYLPVSRYFEEEVIHGPLVDTGSCLVLLLFATAVGAS